jgi:D-sedoheptulose 7-phosphate isomerase
LKNFSTKGDLVIGISGSGNSNNVLKALDICKSSRRNYDWTDWIFWWKSNANLQIQRPHTIDDMQITEDLHMILDHCIMSILSKKDK